jgi:hypothetical protein
MQQEKESICFLVKMTREDFEAYFLEEFKNIIGRTREVTKNCLDVRSPAVNGCIICKLK